MPRCVTSPRDLPALYFTARIVSDGKAKNKSYLFSWRISSASGNTMTSRRIGCAIRNWRTFSISVPTRAWFSRSLRPLSQSCQQPKFPLNSWGCVSRWQRQQRRQLSTARRAAVASSRRDAGWQSPSLSLSSSCCPSWTSLAKPTSTSKRSGDAMPGCSAVAFTLRSRSDLLAVYPQC